MAVGVLALILPFSVNAAALHIVPAEVLQGDPVMITVAGASVADINSATVAGSTIYFFNYRGAPTALHGVDINQKIGTTTIAITLVDGSQLTESLVIKKRVRPDEFMAIPVQLGGNSPANQVRVVSILAKENAELAAIYSRKDKAIWQLASAMPFVFPVASTTALPRLVTNAYGYNRNSGAETITHKGVDFRASVGTPVYAIGRGVVRSARPYVVYGNSVVVDHGLGLLSMYMHLSKLAVYPGQLVVPGQLIGYSGGSGYADGPHLHLTIRIGGVSIDPIKFFDLFKI